MGGVEVGTACGPLVEVETIDIHYRDSPFTLKAVYFQTFFSLWTYVLSFPGPTF